MASAQTIMDDGLHADLQSIEAMYPDQVTISRNPLQVKCVIKVAETGYVVGAQFTKPNGHISVRMYNAKGSHKRVLKRDLQQIQSRLQTLCLEERDDQPIYQCLSYINDSLMHDLAELAQAQNEQLQAQNNDVNSEEKSEIAQHKKVEVNPDLPRITIYTWGNKRRKRAPAASQHNTNVCGVTGYKPRGVSLKQLNGKDKRIQDHVQGGRNYEKYLGNLKHKIMEEGCHTVSINCHKGRHRSVAFAELLAKNLREQHGYAVTVIHLEI